jgi:thymidylate synthase ThyX
MSVPNDENPGIILLPKESHKATLVSWYGDDAAVSDFATMSTGKQANKETLIPNLIKWRHAVPFERVVFEWDIHATLAIMRQITRHAALRGVESSSRYGNVSKELCATGIQEIDNWNIQTMQKVFSMLSFEKRNKRDRELIFSMLPRFAMTRFRCVGNLRGLANFLRQRLANDAQLEIRLIATSMVDAIASAGNIPIALKALKDAQWVL